MTDQPRPDTETGGVEEGVDTPEELPIEELNEGDEDPGEIAEAAPEEESPSA